jgi:hypothetical protein
MAELPWEVVSERLGRFLELRYIATTVSGMIISVESALILTPGSPEQKQQYIASLLPTIAEAKLSALTVLIMALVALLLFYMIGYAARSLFLFAYRFGDAIFRSIRYLMHHIYSSLRYYYPSPSQQGSARREKIQKHLEAFDKRRSRYASKLKKIRHEYAPFLLRPTVESSFIWRNLENTFGEAEVKRVLAKHSISVDKDNPESLYLSLEYCTSWLERYTPDLKPSDDLSRWSLRYLSAVPAILAPAAIGSVIQESPLENDVGLATIVVIGIVLWIIRPPRTTAQLVPLLIFQRFIIAQFLVETKPLDSTTGTGRPETPEENPKNQS